MVVATHVIKVRGIFDREIWNEDKLRKYVRRKIICDMDDSFHTHLKLFKIDGDDRNDRGNDDNNGNVEVWVHVYALPSEIDRGVIEKWIDDHINEEGLAVEEFEFNMMTDTTKYGWKERPFISIPWESFDDMDDEERKLYFDKCDEKWDRQHEINKEYYSVREEIKKEEGINYKYIKKLPKTQETGDSPKII